MKKQYLAILLIALLGVSCSSKMSSKFKSYSYGRQLTEQESTELKENIFENFQNLSKYKTSSTSYLDYGNQKIKTKTTSEVTFVGKSSLELQEGFGVHSERETSTEKTTYGIKSVTKNKNVNDVFVRKNESEAFCVVRGSYVNDDEPTASADVINAETTEIIPEVVERTLYSPDYPSIYGDYTIYKNGDGHAFVYSTISESHYIQEAGSKYADVVNITQSQSIINVNKDNQVTKIKTVSERITNQDPSTGEIFKEKRIISQETSEYSYIYGERTTSNNFYHKYDDILSKPSLSYVELTVMFGRYTNESFSSNSSSSYSNISSEEVNGAWRIEITITPTSSAVYYNSNAFYISYFIYGKRSVLDTNTLYKGTLELNPGSSGFTKVSEDGINYYLSQGTIGASFHISFDVNFNENGIVFRNAIITNA